MKKTNKKATSIIEVMIIVIIISMGILGAFKVFGNGQSLSITTKNKIQAINIAREGLEAITNIRNTNWFLYSSDNESCWNSFNYKYSCIGDKHNNSTYYINSGSYTIFNNGNRWFLNKKTTGNYKDSTYKNAFKVKKDVNGFFTQSGGTVYFRPIFTREIQISYSGTTVGSESFSGSQMIINSKVMWSDSASANPHEVVLSTVLTSWKK